MPAIVLWCLTAHAKKFSFAAGASSQAPTKAAAQTKMPVARMEALEAEKAASGCPADMKSEPASVKAEQGTASYATNEPAADVPDPDPQGLSRAEPKSEAELRSSQECADELLARQMDAGAAGDLQGAGVPVEQPPACSEESGQPEAANSPPGARSSVADTSKRKAAGAVSPPSAKKSRGAGGRTAPISSYFTKNSA